MKNIHITRIKIWGFKGFKTSGVDSADIEFKKKLQQLISTNGSGKSTFLSEVSLSPINKELFYKEGGKLVEFRTNDNIDYRFESNHKGNLLTDITNKTLLTQGMTISHYTELAETLFGYTDYKWKLVTGQMKFTSLTRAERQKWIETISGIDFSYPFRIYASIKGHLTGIKRAIKEYEGELSNNKDRVLCTELRGAREARKTELQEVIGDIIAAKSGTPTVAEIRNKIDLFVKLDNELLIAKADILSRETGLFWHLNVTSLDDFRETYLSGVAELDKMDILFRATEKELSEKIRLRNLLSTKDSFDIEAARKIEIELSATLEELHDLSHGTFNDLSMDMLCDTARNRDDILSAFNLAIMNSLNGEGDIIHTLYNGRRIKERESLKRLEEDIDKIQSNIRHCEEIITNTKAGKDITCPKCLAIFKDGQGSLESTEKRLATLTGDLDRLTIIHENNKAIVERFQEIDSNVAQVKTIINDKVRLGAIRNTLIDHVDGTVSLSDITTKLDTLLEEARNEYRKKSIQMELNDVKQSIAHHEKLASLDNDIDYSKECDHLEEELIIIRERKFEAEKRIKEYGSEGKRLKAFVDELESFDELILKHTDALRDLQETLVSNAVGKLLEDLQVELGKISNELTQDSINVGIRNKLNSMIADNKRKLKVLVDLETAINPSTGIIAEQLTAYCRLFSGYTSHVLSKIWGYEMIVHEPIIHPIRGVNYRFPFTVKDDEVISDIGVGSTSQLAIINLAVTLASRELLKADGQVLFLDEPGAGFDTLHNISLGEFIYELVVESSSKNIFVIHHDQSIRSSLGDYDTIVFDPSQVVVDEGYNENVKLTHKERQNEND